MQLVFEGELGWVVVGVIALLLGGGTIDSVVFVRHW